MIDTTAKPGRPLEPVLARIALAALVGLVVLPALLANHVAPNSRSTDLPTAGISLLLAGIVTIWLLVEARLLAVALAGRVSNQDAVYPIGWVVALVAIGVAQAVLRRPFVAVVGGWTSASGADVAFAATSLVVVVVALTLLHRSAVPLLTATARGALDALVPTVEAEEAEAPISTAFDPAHAKARPEPVTVAVDAATATIAAALAVGIASTEATQLAAVTDHADETRLGAQSAETIAASTKSSGLPVRYEVAHEPAPFLAESDAAATLVAWQPDAEPDAAATIVESHLAADPDTSATIVELQPTAKPTGDKGMPGKSSTLPGGSPYV